MNKERGDIMTRVRILIGIVLFCSLSQVGWAVNEEEVQAKAEFNKLVLQRNGLHRKLQQADISAVELLKAGKDTTKLNAEQITIQDRLDLIQLRLETMAARHTLAIPPVPKPKVQSGTGGGTADSDLGYAVFARGRTRTIKQLRLQTLDLLASLDFSGIKAKIGK